MRGPRLAAEVRGFERGVTLTGIMKRRPNLTVHDLGSEMILYDTTSETFHVLNATARQIWLCLEEDGIAQKLMRLFPQEDPDRIRRDVTRTIDELGRMGLIERVGGLAAGPPRRPTARPPPPGAALAASIARRCPPVRPLTSASRPFPIASAPTSPPKIGPLRCGPDSLPL